MSFKKVKFGDLFEFQKKSNIKAGDGLKSGNYPFFTSSADQSKYRNEFCFEQPGLIFGTGGNASVHFCKGNFSASTDCLVAKPINGNVDPEFIYYYLKGNIHLLEAGFKGAGLKHISKEYISNIDVPIPELLIQKKVKEILLKADSLRRKDQQLLAKYDELLQSIFYQMFGDPVKNEKGWKFEIVEKLLADYKEGTKCGPFGSALKKDEYILNGIPVWVMDNIVGCEFKSRGSLFITEKKFEELKSYGVKNGDIIISRAGTVGKMAVVETNERKSIISTNLIKVSLDRSLLSPYYFVYLMKYQGDKFGRLKKGQDGAFSHMNTGIIRELKIPLPDIRFQKSFEEVLKNILSQKKLATTQIEKSNFFFQTLLQKAFKGELIS